MSNSLHHVIEESNLSYAWGKAFLRVLERPRSPIIVSLGDFTKDEPKENPLIRNGLDALLEKQKEFSSKITAMTIFPYSAWIRNGRPPREEFFDYAIKKLLPRLKKRDIRNSRGMYFERMMAYEGFKKERKVVNQLDFVIALWQKREKRPRHSALQIACFDPAKDHTGAPLSGFPCLQQVSLSYDDDGLTVNALYPTQYIFDRAYGNYLGLCHLGVFLAHELKVKFVRMNCVSLRPELGTVKKGKVGSLMSIIKQELSRR